MDWALETCPDPLSFPVIHAIGLDQDNAHKHVQAATLPNRCITLDLIDTIQGDGDEIALLTASAPVFGLPEDPLCPWSIKSSRVNRIKQAIQEQAHKEPASNGVAQPPGAVVLAASSVSAMPPSGDNPTGALRRTQEIASPAEEAKKKHFCRTSRLSEQQHRHWWALRNASTQSMVNDPFKVEVAAEQRLYRESLKQMVLATCRANFVAFPALVETTIDKLLQVRKASSRAYPAFYTTSGSETMPFFDPRHPPKQLKTLQRKRLLFSAGTTLELPPIPHPFYTVTLPRSGDFFLGPIEPRPPMDDATKKPTFLKQVQPVVSCDAYMRCIAAQTSLSFALSSSVLLCLTNPNLDAAWEVPVIVEELSAGRRVIFLDKPLVPQDLSIKEKNRQFYKMSLKRWLLQNQQGLKMNPTPEQLTFDPAQLAATNGAQTPQLSQGPDNLIYTEWQFDDHQILIRGRTDALASPAESPALPSLPHQPVGIVAKMKHLPDEQLEEFSASEKAKYLLKAFLLGEEAKLVVGHVDPVTARLVSVEMLSQQQLRTPGSASPESYLSQLNEILGWLRKQAQGKTGHFLLRHDAGAQQLSLVRLHAKKEELTFTSGIAASFDLHERQQQAGRSNLESIEYLPPRWDYQRLHQIPNTFLPVTRSCCFDFLRSGKCIHPTTCTHAHMTQYEAELRGLPTPATLAHVHKPSSAVAAHQDSKRQSLDKSAQREADITETEPADTEEQDEARGKRRRGRKRSVPAGGSAPSSKKVRR